VSSQLNFFKFLFCFILLFNFFSCGKSPFQKKVKSQKNKSANNRILKNGRIIGSKTQNILAHYVVEYRWLNQLEVGDEVKMIIEFFDDQKKSKNFLGSIEAYLWMPSMGHGSYPIQVTKISNSELQLSEIFFTMQGDWDLHLLFKENNKIHEEILKIKL
jgi:hypothetical protein